MSLTNFINTSFDKTLVDPDFLNYFLANIAYIKKSGDYYTLTLDRSVSVFFGCNIMRFLDNSKIPKEYHTLIYLANDFLTHSEFNDKVKEIIVPNLQLMKQIVTTYKVRSRNTKGKP